MTFNIAVTRYQQYLLVKVTLDKAVALIPQHNFSLNFGFVAL